MMNQRIFLFALWVLMGCHSSLPPSPPYATFLDQGYIAVLSPQGSMEQWEQGGTKKKSQDLNQKEKTRVFTQILPDTRRFLIVNSENVIISDSILQEPILTLPLPPEDIVGGVFLYTNQMVFATPSGTLYRSDQGNYIKQTQLQWKDDQKKVLTAVFSIDGKKVITISADDPIIRGWDTQTGTLLFTLAGVLGHVSAVSAATFSGDGNVVVSGDQSGKILFWKIDPAVSAPSPILMGVQEEPVTAIAISSDLNLIASGELGGDVLVWKRFPFSSFLSTEPLNQVLWRRFSGHTGKIVSLSFSRNTFQLLSSSTDQTVRVWSTEPDQSHTWILPVTAVEFSPDQIHFLAVISDPVKGYYVGLWNLSDLRIGNTVDPTPIFVISAAPFVIRNNSFSQSYYALRFSPDGSLFLASAQGEIIASTQVDVWKLFGPQKIGIIKDTELSESVIDPQAPLFSPNGKFAFNTHFNQLSHCFDLLFWDIDFLSSASSGPDQNVPQAGAVRCLQSKPASQVLLSPDQKKIITLNELTAEIVDSSELQASFPVGEITQQSHQIPQIDNPPKQIDPSLFSATQFLPDGKTLMLITNKSLAQTWDLQDGSHPILKDFWIPMDTELNRNFPVNSMQLSLDQKYMMMATGSSHIGLYDLATHKKQAGIIAKDNRKVEKALFVPGGKEIMVIIRPTSNFSPIEGIQLLDLPILQEVMKFDFSNS